MKRVVVDDFSRGLRFQDYPATELTAYVPYMLNMTVRGSDLVKRWGVTQRLATSGNATITRESPMFYSAALNKFYQQRSAELYQYDTDWASETLIKTFTTGACVGMCDFGGKLVVIHPADGVYDWDGATFTSRNTTVKGDFIVPWQNKLWAGGNGGGVRLWWSNAGSSATWTTASDFIDIRTIDDKPLTGAAVAHLLDQSGRGGLVITKASSSYRVYDSSTGAYAVLDNNVGCPGSSAICTIPGGVFLFGPKGAFVSNGLDPFDFVSDAINNLFTTGTASVAQPRLWNCVSAYGRVYLSYPHDAFGAGTPAYPLYVYEYHVDKGWWAMHQLTITRNMGLSHGTITVGGMAGACVYTGTNERLEMAYTGGKDVVTWWNPDSLPDSMSIALETDEGNGSNNAITAEVWTPPVYFDDHVRVHRVRLHGIGAVTVGTWGDATLASAGPHTFNVQTATRKFQLTMSNAATTEITIPTSYELPHMWPSPNFVLQRVTIDYTNLNT